MEPVPNGIGLVQDFFFSHQERFTVYDYDEDNKVVPVFKMGRCSRLTTHASSQEDLQSFFYMPIESTP
jgi:hypothetical protein